MEEASRLLVAMASKRGGGLPALPGAPVEAAAPAESLPTPTPTESPPLPSPELERPCPSWLKGPPPSDEEDSSCDEDEFDVLKPARPTAYDSAGRPRPRPSYYYDPDFQLGGHVLKKFKRGGEKGVPVFEPTMQEFAEEGGFYGYVKRIEKYGLRSGIVKVIPPAAWTGALPSTAVPLESIRLKEPIEQHIHGSQGLYRVTNVAKTRIWNVAQWKEAAETHKYAPPNFVADKDLPDRSERSSERANPRRNRKPRPVVEAVPPPNGGLEALRRAMEEAAETPVDTPIDLVAPPFKTHAEPAVDPPVETPAEPAVETPVETPAEPSAAPPIEIPVEAPHSPVASTSTLPPAESENTSFYNFFDESYSPPVVVDGAVVDGAVVDAPPRKAPRPRRPTNAERAEPTEAEWDAFLTKFEALPHSTKREDYTIEIMREIERRYWRTLTFGEAPMYGADMAGSLFDESTTDWNVANLGDLLPRLAPTSCRIPGVVSPYLYFGMWRATFAWHVEDADLYSINYIHFGAPKFWYSVPQVSSAKFERVMRSFFPTDEVNCAEFLRHKQFLASPRALANEGVTLNRVIQLPGEFILTYPKGYHSGFNLGFNCAESVNFATERWIPLGREAKSCVCIGDSVNIDVDAWLAEAVAEEEGIPYRYNGHGSAPRRKRMAPPPRTIETEYSLDHDEPVRKRTKIIKTAPTLAPKTNYHQSKLVKEVATRQSEDYICLLCPSMSKEGLVQVLDAPGDPKYTFWAHRICGMFTPETWMDGDAIRGFGAIEKARWSLKCALCSIPHGSKIQCTKGKCPIAFHATCAMKEGCGIHIDALVVEAGVKVSIFERAKKDALVAREALAAQEALAAASRVEVEDGDVGMDPEPEKGPPKEVVEDVTMVDAAPATRKSLKIKMKIPISIVVLCRTHNPTFQKSENIRKAAELQARVLALELDSRIRVRTARGVFEVTLREVCVDQMTIRCEFDDEQPMELKWKAISWPENKDSRQKKSTAPSDSQIWIDDTDCTPAPSTSRREVVASVQMPPPYSNYCPTELFTAAPSSASPPPPILPALPDFPLDLEMSSMRSSPPVLPNSTTQDFPPFQPHVFSFGGLTHSPPVPPTASTSKSTSMPPSYNRPVARHPDAIPDHVTKQGRPSSDRERRQTISSASMPPPFARADSDNRRSSLAASHAFPSFQDYRMDRPSTTTPAPLSYPPQNPKDGRTLPSIASLLQTSDPLEGLVAPTAFYDNGSPASETAATGSSDFGARRDSLGGGRRAEAFEAARRESAGSRK